MSKNVHLELKVGGLVILAFFVLTVAIFTVGDFEIFEEGQNMKVIFNFANGLKVNAPVRVAGVDAGLVKDINLFFDGKDERTKVEVLVRIREGVNIPRDSEIMINQLGLFGEKYVEILPGKDRKHFFSGGDMMIGKEPVMQEVLAGKIMDAAGQIEKSVGEIQNFLGEDNQESFQRSLKGIGTLSEGLSELVNDEENRQSVKDTLKNLSSVTDRLDQLIGHIEEGKGNIGMLMTDDRLYDDLQSFAADIKAHPWKLLYQPKER